jgi:NHLM bacteriocin system ABC transporter ATP-binding protein
MNLTRLADAFTRDGFRQPTGGNRPFWVDESSSVWLVETGSVDLFVVPVNNGRLGSRRHLLRAGPGRLIFGLSQDEAGPTIRLQAVGSNGAAVHQLARARLQELCAEGACLSEISHGLDGWIQGVYGHLSGGALPQESIPLHPGRPTEVPAGKSAQPLEGVIWVKHLKGQSRLVGLAELTIDGAAGLVPLTPEVWLEAVETATLTSADTVAGIREGVIWLALSSFDANVRIWAARKLREALTELGTRLELKNQSQRLVVNTAVERLAEPLARGPLKAQVFVQRGDPLLDACELVGRALGVKTSETTVAGGELKDALDRWARTARVRVRRVILSDEWWTEDNGPMLAYVQATSRPVALLPDSPTSYSLADPVDRTRRAVTRDLAHSLNPRAYSLYRSFPETSPKVWDIFRFGLQNTKGDQRMILLLSLAGGLLGMAMPLATGVIFDTIIPSNYRPQLWFIALVLLAAGGSAVIFEITRGIGLLRLQAKSEVAIAGAVWDRLLSLPVPFFRRYTAGDLAMRANGINAMQQILAGAAISSVLGAVFSLFNFGLLFYYSARLAGVASVLVLLNMSAMLLASWGGLRLQRPLYELQGKLSGLVLQFITGISKLRVAGAEPEAFAVWAKHFGEQKKLDLKMAKLSNTVAVFNESYPLLTSICLFAVVAFGIEPGLSTGKFLAFNVAFLGFLYAGLSAGDALIGILHAVPIYERVRPILQALPEVQAVKADPGELRGSLELSHVSFRYKADSPLVLNDVSLHINAGEFVALVGPSGVGKSTIMRLVLGFEFPESGTIRYDGLDLAGLDVQAVRRQIGVVLQNGKLMPGDIFENIVGSGLFTLEDAWEAAKRVGLEQDIQLMPMGMHTVLGETAGTLSGGQRQRLMIARAIVAKPRILLFDEATSALDNRTQAVVAESLKQLQATRVVIAHRLSTIINADRILVLQQGKVVQTGCYETLIKEPGVFAELARRQLA